MFVKGEDDMILDTNWRSSFYEAITEREQEDNMKTKDDVKKFFEAQFMEFSQPIKHLTNVYDKDGLRYYKAYDRAIGVDFKDDIIKFYRIPLSSKGIEVEKELFKELTHNGEVFVEMIGNGQRDQFVNKSFIEIIFQKGFQAGQAVRY